jgi:hypothetical protein
MGFDTAADGASATRCTISPILVFFEEAFRKSRVFRPGFYAPKAGAAFSTTPAVWVQMHRVEAVRQHLESGYLGLKEIAARTTHNPSGCGPRRFATPISMPTAVC